MGEGVVVAAGGQDWAQIWRDMYTTERAQADALTPEGLIDPKDFWASRAKHYHEAADRVVQPDSFMRFVLPHIRPTDRVADIGAGGGRYLPSLARACNELLAIEPSPAMRANMERMVARESLDNVRLIPEDWLAANVEPFDVAVCAHVLYAIHDAAPFLQRIDELTRRACFLLLGLRHPASPLGAFWQYIYGEPRLPLPAAIETVNLLYQLGINANLTVIPITSILRYLSVEEALVDVRWRMRLAPSPENDATVLAAINELMIRDEHGALIPPNVPPVSAVVWWQKDA